MVAITEFLFEDLAVTKNDNWPGPDITGVPASTDTNPPIRQHIVLEKGTVNQDGYVRFEFFGAMTGEDWFLLVGAASPSNLWDINVQAPA
jgi:hypothetical protein